MADLEKDKRLDEIIDMIANMASLDFSQELEISNNHDKIDAIALGLNMLSEELDANVVDKIKLDKLNNKLEKFAYTTAHDLKSPLNSLTSLINLLEFSINKNDTNDILLFLEKMKKTNEQMKSLVKGILENSVQETYLIKKENINLNELVEEVIEIDQVRNRAEINIEGKLPCVTFNRTIIIQVIRNLINNAIKYNNQEQCLIKINAVNKNLHYYIVVSDNGPGISEKNHKSIFELFNQIHPLKTQDSMGIGLATLKNILEASGEKIWVESESGKGASFIFTIKKL